MRRSGQLEPLNDSLRSQLRPGRTPNPQVQRTRAHRQRQRSPMFEWPMRACAELDEWCEDNGWVGGVGGTARSTRKFIRHSPRHVHSVSAVGRDVLMEKTSMVVVTLEANTHTQTISERNARWVGCMPRCSEQYARCDAYRKHTHAHKLSASTLLAGMHGHRDAASTMLAVTLAAHTQTSSERNARWAA